MTWWQALVLGLVEGVTEYLPVSSTGHLILTAWLLGMADDAERWSAVYTFNIVIQSGAIAAVLILYRQRVGQMLAGVAGRDREGLRLALHLAIAFLPAAVFGLAFDDAIERHLNGPWPVAVALLAGALVMLAVAARQRRRGDGSLGLDALDVRSALIIGCCQCLAMWPGTSRSMTTIVAALLLGFSATAAAEITFLLGLVTLSAATGYKFLTGGSALLGLVGPLPLAIGLAAATVSAALAVRWFVGFLTRHGLAPFAWYRLALALLLILALATGWLDIPAPTATG